MNILTQELILNLHFKHITIDELLNLTHLSLANKKIDAIDPEAFQNLKGLIELQLEINKIEQIDNETFSHLTSLKKLWLWSNQLGEIDENIFKNLGNLLDLSLSTNKIATVHPKAFKNLKQLDRLWLCENEITSISSKLFDNLTNLRILFLESNQLDFIQGDTFRNLHNLEKLSLHSNKLNCIDSQAFINLVKLKELHLNHNQLVFIHWNTFKSLVNLEKISLQSNKLRTIDPMIFKNLFKLKEIYMHNNEFIGDKLELCIEENVLYVSFKKVHQLCFSENNILDIIEPDLPNRKIYNFCYVKKSKLGSGSFGNVFLVEDINTKKPYALKIFQFANAFLNKEPREIEVLKSLDVHEHVIHYYDHFLFNEKFYLVIEFCEGGDLDSLLSQMSVKSEFFDDLVVMEYLRQILLGVHFLHSNEIVHRDIKPANILINKGKLKLGDFGLAKQLENTSISAACTPIYASPEMIEKRFDSAVRVTKNTDIWSVGCVLFELKKLKKAFDYFSLEILRFHLKIHRPQDLIDESSPFLRYLCNRLLNINPDKRPSAEVILKEVDEIRDSIQKDSLFVSKLTNIE